MKKIFCLMVGVFIVGCATTKDVQIVGSNTQVLADAYNRLLDCIDESGKEFGKVVPCVRRKLESTPTPTPTATPIKLAAK